MRYLINLKDAAIHTLTDSAVKIPSGILSNAPEIGRGAVKREYQVIHPILQPKRLKDSSGPRKKVKTEPYANVKPYLSYSAQSHGLLFSIESLVTNGYFHRKEGLPKSSPFSAYELARNNFIKKVMWMDMEKNRVLKRLQKYKCFIAEGESPGKLQVVIPQERVRHWCDMVAHQQKCNGSHLFNKLNEEAQSWKRLAPVQVKSPETLIQLLMYCERLNSFPQRYGNFKHFWGEDSPYHRFVAFDIEAYEFRQDILTELGICTFDRKSGDTNHRHIIIREHQSYKNKRRVANARHMFAYGESEILSLVSAFDLLVKELSQPGTVMVGHALKCDLKYLRDCKMPRDDGSRIDEAFLNSLPHLDTQAVHKLLWGYGSEQRLETIVRDVDIIPSAYHNAGNDAALTMAAILALLKIESPHDPLFMRSLTVK